MSEHITDRPPCGCYQDDMAIISDDCKYQQQAERIAALEREKSTLQRDVHDLVAHQLTLKTRASKLDAELQQFRDLAELVESGWVNLTTVGDGWEFTREVDGKRYGAVTKQNTIIGTGENIIAYVGEYEAHYPLHTAEHAGPCMVRRVKG